MLNELRTIPTFELCSYASEAEKEGNQQLANIYIYELAYRLYVPGTSKSFEDLLNELGYKIPEERQQKKLVKS